MSINYLQVSLLPKLLREGLPQKSRPIAKQISPRGQTASDHTYLQSLQTYKAGNGKSINDVFLTRHRFSLPPTWRSVPGTRKDGPTFSTTSTKKGVSATFLLWAWGRWRGSKVRSPPASLSITLRTGATALSQPSTSTRPIHVESNPTQSVQKALKPWSTEGPYFYWGKPTPPGPK